MSSPEAADAPGVAFTRFSGIPPPSFYCAWAGKGRILTLLCPNLHRPQTITCIR